MNNNIIFNKFILLKKEVNNQILTINKNYNIKDFVVSLSGGFDSVFLLELLLNIKNTLNNNFNIEAIHINHNINKNSNN